MRAHRGALHQSRGAGIGRVENVHTIHDLVTPVSADKIGFQVMSEKEVVSAFFSSCVHAENLTIGLYCIEGNVKTLSKKERLILHQ
ncbi:unnamed protein product [Ranitomeya imitator]|uniref:Uncharacterized protein n=1 Tax=Ranitomeya imitator TaxID=111125 RepID=A0ABN9L7I2_9NEOB|nr:unnamed protein product [Ranitomeya imitator]